MVDRTALLVAIFVSAIIVLTQLNILMKMYKQSIITTIINSIIALGITLALFTFLGVIYLISL